MSANKTLIILTPAFPADESGRESVWLPAKQQLIQCLNKNYPWLEIVIISFHFPLLDKPFKWRENLVIPLSGANKTKGRQWWTWLKALRQLRRLSKEKKIIAILSFWCAECCLIGHYYGLIAGLQHFCWICGQDAKKSNRLVRYIRPRSQELVAMSDFLRESFEKNHGITPAWLIPDALDISQFSRCRQSRDIDIIGVGGLSPLKQYTVWIDIIGAIKVRFPGIKACLCGDGEQRDLLQAKIRALGLQENISMTGQLPREEVLQLMQRAKILLHPSSYEGFGNVLLEALYAGAYVISFVRPVQRAVPKWFIVDNQSEMVTQALELLAPDTVLSHDPFLLFDMNESASCFMKLFLGRPADPDQ